METLFAYGIMVFIGLFLGLIITVIGLFFGHIIFFDSVLLAAIFAVVCSKVWAVHTALCLLAAVALFFILFLLQNIRIGFWIIGILMSAFGAFVFGFFAYEFSGYDMIWFYVILGLGFIMMMGLHLRARDA